MKKFFKNLLRSQWFAEFAAWLGAKYVYFCYITTQWQFIGDENIQPYWQNNKRVLGVFWHGRMAMMCYSWRDNTDFYMLISAHRDGRIISNLIHHLGYKTITGSSSRGGAQALRGAIDVLHTKGSMGITPDGPRGPRYSIDIGTINIARLAKVDIVPATFSKTNQRRINSWDRLIFPLPFGKGVYIYGKPIKYEEIKDKKNYEWAAAELEKRLITIGEKADKMCGHPPIPKKDD